MSDTSQKPNWAISFNIDDVTWAKLSEAAQSRQRSPLSLALDSNIINEVALITWERKNSKIPTLKSDFFNGAPPLELFKKFDFAQCQLYGSLPVTDWNGQIYWAKLSTEKSPFEVAGAEALWFLAPWSGMKKWFAIWETEMTTALQPTAVPPTSKIIPQISYQVQPQVKAPLELPSQPATAAPLPQPEDLANVFEFGETNVLAPPPSTGSDLKVINEMPLDVIPPPDPSHILEKPSESLVSEHTFVEPQPETMILETVVRPPPVSDGPVGLTQYNSEATAALDFSSLLVESKPSSTSEISSMQGTSSISTHGEIDLAPSFSSLELESNSTGEIIVPFDTKPNISQVQSPPPPAPQAAPKPMASVTPSAPAPAPTPTSMPQAVTKTIETLSPELYEKRLRTAQNQDGLAEVLMGVWQTYFTQVMILLFQQDRLIIWWDNGKFLDPVKKGETVSLETPSVFKIVSSTGHPFHGPVMPSAENEKFFKKTNGGKYPEHLTIVPVMAGDRVVAMLLGTTQLKNAKTIILPKLEDDAKIFASALFKITGSSRQAS